jgi:hypothetical protein
MMWRAFDDVHVQGPPEALSISLNLLVRTERDLVRPQLLFDTEANVVRGVELGRARQARIDLCRLTAMLGDQQAVEPLTAIAHQHPDPLTRLSAYEAWSQLGQGDAWRHAVTDDDERIRSAARARFEAAGEAGLS